MMHHAPVCGAASRSTHKWSAHTRGSGGIRPNVPCALLSPLHNSSSHLRTSSLLSRPQQQQHVPLPKTATSATATTTGGGPGLPPHENESFLEALISAYTRFSKLAGKFMPMVVLFFFLSFVNTILDSLKDTLVITAAGGGAQVIPYLTVYAVLPSSLIFLVAYSLASQRLTRGQLFNAIIIIFMSFFACFAFVMYPNHHTLHPHDFSDSLAKMLPNGVDGLVGMIRNWTFTLFFCISELWGDVCLGLLFWGLANDTTNLEDAGLMYPLFGLGANVAQALAGSVLKFFSRSPTPNATEAATAAASEAANFSQEVQGLMIVVMVFSAAALALHSFIDSGFRKGLLKEKRRKEAEQKKISKQLKQELQMAGLDKEQRRMKEQLQAELDSLSSSSSSSSSEEDEVYTEQAQQQDRLASHSAASAGPSSSNGSTTNESANVSANGSSSETTSSLSSSESTSTNGVNGGIDASSQQQQQKKGKKEKKPKASVMEIFAVLAASTPIRCLTIMSLAQGLCTNLMEFAWKSHIGLLFPGPKEFTSFMGDVSMWQGLVTGLLMIATPAMFDKLGWAGVAQATPTILLWGGVTFFAACMVYQFGFASHAAEVAAAVLTGAAENGQSGAAAAAEVANANGSMGALVLRGLVFGGALLYVFSKSAKFSLFKPAEEMVYISLDEEGRTKGKAAIDVVGSQAGKSGGSVLQQVLLLATGGAIGSILPVMFAFYFAMARGWLQSVTVLSNFANYGHNSSVHESIGVLNSMDEEELLAQGGASVQVTPQVSPDVSPIMSPIASMEEEEETNKRV